MNNPPRDGGRRVIKQRHHSTVHLLSLFEYEHLPPHLQDISKPLHDLAHDMADHLEDGPELSTGLRHLWDAKNNLVMQRVIDRRKAADVWEDKP